MSECDSSDHPVSIVVVVTGVKFFGFSTSLEPMHGFASNVVWMFLGWTTTKFVKIGVLTLFFMELLVNCAIFGQFLKNLL